MSEPQYRYRRVDAGFAARTAAAKRILVIDIAGLGDLVHALPALWLIRQQYPQARLDVVANAHWSALLRCTPWIDRVWAYEEKKKSVHAKDWQMARALRAQRYDLSINLMGSNRSCLIAWLSGARISLGRKPFEVRRPAWRWLNSVVMEAPYRTELRYLQKWQALRSAGIGAASGAPEFHIEREVPLPAALAAEGTPPPYLHLSPYTSARQKELPPAQMAELIAALQVWYPQYRLVLSCAPAARELAALQELLTRLPQPPWRVFAGTLDTAELYALLRHAALNLSGDTGTLHLAWLAATPSVAWYNRPGGTIEWVPPQAPVQLVYNRSAQAPQDYLRGVETADLLNAVAAALSVPAPAPAAAASATSVDPG